MALSADAVSVYSQKPKPLDLPVSRSNTSLVEGAAVNVKSGALGF
jgi:hypothetical protein